MAPKKKYFIGHGGKFVKILEDETGFEFVESAPGEGVALGETSGTAYRGDRGKIAYDHSQSAHAPSNATQNSSDASLRDRSTHTGSQAISTITGLEDALADAETNSNNYTDSEITELKDGVSTSGDTLQKLYNLIIASVTEVIVADITERNALDIALGAHVFVEDDGDATWALYKAITAGVDADYVKLSDPDLLNAVMSNAAIKAAYESNADTNAFTNALKAKLDAISGTNTGDETAARIATINHGTATKSALVNADEVTGQNSESSYSLIRTTWGEVKAFLKTYFDTVYQAVLVSATNIKTINGSSILGAGDLVVSGTIPSVATSKLAPAENITISTGYGGMAVGSYKIVDTYYLKIESGASFKII